MKKILTYICCFYSFNALATEKQIYSNKLNHCTITRSTMNDYEPEIFQSNNNLLRKTGQQPIYCGRKIIIKGRVLDQNCVPVSDAKIYLWQKGCDGKYPYKTLRNRVNKKLLNFSSFASFTGSGTATTNNKGEFYFITIYPDAATSKAADVNIRVEHRNLESLQTTLHLSSKNANVDQCGETDSKLVAIADEIQSYYFDVVVKGTTTRRY